MDIFNASEKINETEATIALLKEELNRHEQILELQKTLAFMMEDANKFDPMDHEYQPIAEAMDRVGSKLAALTAPDTTNA